VTCPKSHKVNTPVRFPEKFPGQVATTGSRIFRYEGHLLFIKRKVNRKRTKNVVRQVACGDWGNEWGGDRQMATAPAKSEPVGDTGGGKKKTKRTQNRPFFVSSKLRTSREGLCGKS